jgi:hypothetical protein
MKTRHPFFLTAILFAALAIAASPLQAAPPDQPAISSIQLEGTNLIVKVAAPAGLVKLTLEGRARLDGSAWQPRAVQRFDSPTTEPAEVTFTVPRSENVEVLRLRADDFEAIPSRFFLGTNRFNGSLAGTTTGTGGGAGNVFYGPQDNVAIPPGGAQNPTTTVVESDIWKVAGNTLYFFNNLRGLQLIDIANPAAPVIKGTYPVSASGEEMYVLASGHAVLLTQSWCYSDSAGDQSHLLIIDPSGPAPTLAADVPIYGNIVESRLVDQAIYVVSQFYRQVVTGSNAVWESGSMLTSVDVSDPKAPVKRKSMTLNNYTGMATATARYFFSATSTGNGASDLQIIDISSPIGEFENLSTIRLHGQMADKFKLQVDGDVLTTVSVNSASGALLTKLETFSLANPRQPIRLGSLPLAQGEQLYATRFDGKRAYIVTYRRIDPLWIVDLSDPAHPTISGELHVPGWSTFLQPMGDRLLALGVDDTNSWRVAVSLFDVANPKAPSLLSKVILGQNNSWSEAQSNEKAFTVLRDDGLILVPWQSYSATDSGSYVQLIDLGRDTVTARGRISDHITPRRATLEDGHIISISGRELTAHDATDRDHPALKASLSLSWPVSQVRLVGGYLLEFERGNSYGYWGSASTPAVIRVARADQPDRVLESVTLTNGLPISGVDVRDGKLYVAQSRSQSWGIFFYATVDLSLDGQAAPAETETGAFVTSVWDLGALPALAKVGQTVARLSQEMSGDVTALWPKNNLLVWSGGSSSYGWNWGWGGPVMAGPGMVLFANDALWYPNYWGSSGGRLAAFDVANSAAPEFRSEVTVTTNSGWNFTKGVVAEGLIYLSHQQNELVPLPTVKPPPVPGDATGSDDVVTNYTVITRYFLDVVDFADAANPLVRKPVNIPGSLQGVSHQGAMLYTVAAHYTADGASDGTEWLDASAYDGVNAFLVASQSLGAWPHPVFAEGADIFIGRATTLERWRLSDEGVLKNVSTTATKESVNALRFFGDLLALNLNAKIQLYDARDRADLKPIGESRLSCYGSNDLQASDGSLTCGLWIPQSDYGVLQIPLAP